MIHPRDFVIEYVHPAIALFTKNSTVPHLAMHAIAQMDVLAEVVAIFVLSKEPLGVTKQGVSAFRKALGTDGRHPILARVRDAHDCHKHGVLTVTKPERPISKGQRPQTVKKAGFFVGHSFLGGAPTIYETVALRLNDGTHLYVPELLHDAAKAWMQEFKALGLDWPTEGPWPDREP